MSGRVVDWAGLVPREVIAGFNGRFAHSERMTFVMWDIAAGAVLPAHSHEHEQVLVMLEGRFEATVEGGTMVLEPGMLGMVPPNAVHSGVALTDCRILDVFAPVREDYKAGGVGGVLQQAAKR